MGKLIFPICASLHINRVCLFVVPKIWGKERYGVEYTPKQVWIITRKKLRLNYRKPYLVYDKAPENADEIFKKNIKNRPQK